MAATYDGSSTAAGVKLYVEGVQDTGGSVEFDTLSSSTISAGAFIIGNQTNFEGSFFLGGALDEFRFSNIARSGAYIAAHASAAAGGLYPFNTAMGYLGTRRSPK